MRIVRYNNILSKEWDNLVNISTTATFIHQRKYMDYHSHIFIDCSLLVFDDNNRLIALLPANIIEDTVYSHSGLTYGGWIIDSRHVNTTVMLEIWRESLQFYKGLGYKRIVYKALPSIYHRYPSEDDLYSIFRMGGSLKYVQISSTINLKDPLKFDSNARRGVKYALNNNIIISESDDFDKFWDILTCLLKERYNTTPTHSKDEITLLKSRFPNNIRLFGAFKDSEMIAGTVIYITDKAYHTQYIAASALGKELKALPLLFSHVISLASISHDFFDFGTSNENLGTYLNEGLIRQKCGMGGRGIAYPTYEIPII